jgi:hypothetical protein
MLVPIAIGDILRAKLPHDVCTMNFDCARAYSQLDGSLFAGSACHELGQHFAFALGQGFATGKRRNTVQPVDICPPAACGDRSLHARGDRAAAEGFLDEIKGAMLDGFDRHGNIALARDHKDGSGILFGVELLENLQA